jgi:hypothetical protein
MLCASIRDVSKVGNTPVAVARWTSNSVRGMEVGLEHLCREDFPRDALPDASVAVDLLFGDPAAFFAGEQSGNARYVARLAEAQRGELLRTILARKVNTGGQCDSRWTD